MSTQTCVHWVGDAIQPSHPLSSASPPFPSLYSIVVRLCCYWVTKSCLTLCDLMDCSPPGSSIHGISQARILEWVAISFSMGSSWPRDPACFFCIGRWILYCWATKDAHHSSRKIQLFPYITGTTLLWHRTRDRPSCMDRRVPVTLDQHQGSLL